MCSVFRLGNLVAFTVAEIQNPKTISSAVSKSCSNKTGHKNIMAQFQRTHRCKRYIEALKIKHHAYPNVLRNADALSNHSICLVTQLTFARLERLQMLANYW